MTALRALARLLRRRRRRPAPRRITRISFRGKPLAVGYPEKRR